MGIKGVPHHSRGNEPDEAARSKCSKGTGRLAPPSDVIRSRAGIASIRGERSSGTTRLGLMLQPRVAVSGAMLSSALSCPSFDRFTTTPAASRVARPRRCPQPPRRTGERHRDHQADGEHHQAQEP